MKIAVCGSAPSSAGLAPFRDKSYAHFVQGATPNYPPSLHIGEDWEIWGCSPGLFGVSERATRWFEVHRWEPGKEWFSPQYCQWLREFKGPVYTGCVIPELPTHVVYPLERVEDEFSSYFLTSSLALMMALAILEIEDERKKEGHDDMDDVIGLWGVDMAAHEEWAEQRPGCQHFILEALRRGIGVYVPPESDLLRPMPVYRISEHDHNYIKLTARFRELNARHQRAKANADQAMTEVHMTGGALDDMNYMIKTWMSPYGLPPGMVLRRNPDKPS